MRTTEHCSSFLFLGSGLNLIKLSLERGKCQSWHKCIQIAIYGVLTRSDLFQDFKFKL